MEFPSASGTLLASAPDMLDPNFMHTVVLICEHSEEGAFGFVVNRESGLTLQKLMPEHPVLGTTDLVVNSGGPVGLDTLQFVHRRPNEISGGHEIFDGVFLGGELEELAELSQVQPVTVAQDVRLFLGYSGWGAGQLEAELEAGAWLPAPASAEALFAADPRTAWKRVLRSLGNDSRGLEDLPPDVSWN